MNSAKSRATLATSRPWSRWRRQSGSALLACLLLIPHPGSSQIAAEAFMAKSDWKSAAPLLEAHLAGFPNDDLSAAELGHVYDKLGDQDMALYWLNYALFIAPRSLEGNLYLGEYYLGQKDKAAVLARLKKLDDICIFGCPEYRILKRAVAQYGAQTP